MEKLKSDISAIADNLNAISDYTKSVVDAMYYGKHVDVKQVSRIQRQLALIVEEIKN
jgi:hypothetical protein